MNANYCGLKAYLVEYSTSSLARVAINNNNFKNAVSYSARQRLSYLLTRFYF